jgi:hypothetical protein
VRGSTLRPRGSRRSARRKRSVGAANDARDTPPAAKGTTWASIVAARASQGARSDLFRRAERVDPRTERRETRTLRRGDRDLRRSTRTEGVERRNWRRPGRSSRAGRGYLWVARRGERPLEGRERGGT